MADDIDAGALTPISATATQTTDRLMLVRAGGPAQVFALQLSAALAAFGQNLPTTVQATGQPWLNGGFLCFGPATGTVSGGGGSSSVLASSTSILASSTSVLASAA